MELSHKEVEGYLRSKTDKVMPQAMFFPLGVARDTGRHGRYHLDLSFHFTMGTEKLATDWKPVVLKNTKDFLTQVRDQLDLAIKDLEQA